MKSYRQLLKTAFKVAACVLAVCVWLTGCSESLQGTESDTEAVYETDDEILTDAWTEPVSVQETDAEELKTMDISDVKVGMIFYGDEDDGSVLIYSLQEELKKAAEQLGMAQDQLYWRWNSRQAGWTEIEDSILECIDAGCQLIFGGAREYDSVIAAIAEEYPDVMFACVGSSLSNGINSGGFDIHPGAAEYLCGTIAASVSSSGKIGFIAAKGTENKLVTDAVNAFAYGVWSVNPYAEIDLGITGKWFLPDAEMSGTEQLIALGCDVAACFTDSSACLRAAAAEGLAIISCGISDGSFYGSDPDAAAEWKWSEYFTMKINQVLDRQVTGELWTGDYFSGAEGFSLQTEDFNDVPAAACEQIKLWSQTLQMEDGTDSEAVSADENENDDRQTLSPAEDRTDNGPPAQTAEESEAFSEEEQDQTESQAPEEEQDQSESVCEISLDPDTGYLTNVKLFTIEQTDEEQTEETAG